MMRIEKLIDLMLQKVAENFECDSVDNCIFKWGHPEESPMMEIKYDVHLKDETVGKAFEDLWDEEVAKLGVDCFPLSFDNCVYEDEDYILVGVLNWCTFREQDDEYKTFIEIADKATSIGYNLQGDEQSDLKEYIKGVQHGSLKLYKGGNPQKRDSLSFKG